MNFDGFKEYSKEPDHLAKRKRIPFYSLNNPEVHFKDKVITTTINYMKPHVIGLVNKIKRKHNILTADRSVKQFTFNHSLGELQVVAIGDNGAVEKKREKIKYEDILEVLEHPYSEATK